MTEQRYEMLTGIRQFRDTLTDKHYCEYNLDKVVELLNKYYNEIVELKLDIEELKPFKEAYTTDPVVPLLHEKIAKLITENEQLKEDFYKMHESQQKALNEVLKLKEKEREDEFKIHTLEKGYTCRGCAFSSKEFKYIRSLEERTKKD